ncbi:MAG TPA: hypothetical protein VF323_13170 [Candidatus Limnocylindrales bacterium]
MSWYFQHQRARDIIAEHEREADRIRLARLYDEGQRSSFGARPTRSPIRRAAGAAVLAIGAIVTRIGRALDDAEATPSA